MKSTTTGQPRLLKLEEFAALIRKMREVFQWSQETLAELAGLHVRTVQRVENAKSAMRYVENWKMVATSATTSTR